MVRIKTLDDVDRVKLKALFEKRGHSILDTNFLDRVKEILDGKVKGMEVHQCQCGELMTLEEKYAEQLRRKYCTDEIPCKVCGDREEDVFSLKILKQIKEITEFLDERSIFVTKSLSTFKPEDVEVLGKMAKGLFPTSTDTEMLIGYYDFIEALAAHVSGKLIKSQDFVKPYFDDARIKSPNEFEKLHSSVLDWEMYHRAYMNLFGKEDILDSFMSKDSSKSLDENLVEKEKLDLGVARIQLKLSAFQAAIEIPAYLDILANVFAIIHGKEISAHPFKTLRLPPKKKLGKERRITSLSDKMEFLGNKLPFDIADVYDTQLRNAVAHNEYYIDEKKKEIILTRYRKTITFDEFEVKYTRLKELHHFIDQYLGKYHVEKLRPEARNQGVDALIIGYTNFVEDHGKFHPNPPCDSQASILQYWDFVEYDEGRRLFPEFKIEINEKSQLTFDFGKNGAFFFFPKSPETVEWAEQLIVTGRLNLALHTIAPKLPIFAQMAITKCSIGENAEVYVLNMAEKTIDVPVSLLKELTKFIQD